MAYNSAIKYNDIIKAKIEVYSGITYTCNSLLDAIQKRVFCG